MRDVYPATTGPSRDAAGYHTPDEDVYLPGRNIILLGKTGVFCAAAGIGRLVLGTLDHNPFPDAHRHSARRWRPRSRLGLGARLTIDAPFARASKAKSSAAASRSACRWR